MSEIVELCAWWSINNTKRDQEQAEESWIWSKLHKMMKVFNSFLCQNVSNICNISQTQIYNSLIKQDRIKS